MDRVRVRGGGGRRASRRAGLGGRPRPGALHARQRVAGGAAAGARPASRGGGRDLSRRRPRRAGGAHRARPPHRAPDVRRRLRPRDGVRQARVVRRARRQRGDGARRHRLSRDGALLAPGADALARGAEDGALASRARRDALSRRPTRGRARRAGVRAARIGGPDRRAALRQCLPRGAPLPARVRARGGRGVARAASRSVVRPALVRAGRRDAQPRRRIRSGRGPRAGHTLFRLHPPLGAAPRTADRAPPAHGLRAAHHLRGSHPARRALRGVAHPGALLAGRRRARCGGPAPDRHARGAPLHRPPDPWARQLAPGAPAERRVGIALRDPCAGGARASHRRALGGNRLHPRCPALHGAGRGRGAAGT